MVDTKHVFQISGIKSPQKKGKLLHGIQKLRGKYIGGSVYREGTTHLIVTRTLPREKFLSACAGGKWIVTPEYVLDSVKNRAWLPEGPYELNVAYRTPGASNPARVWRERVASGALTGAFEGWVVLMMIHNPYRRDLFTRILKAGKAKVYFSPPPLSKVELTHVLVRHVTEHVKLQNAPCYSLNHIAKHLFWNTCVDMGSNWLHEPQEDHSEDDSKKQPQKHPEEPDKHPQEPQQYPEEIPQEPQQYPEEIPQESVSTEANDNLFSALETELRDYVSKVEQGQNSFAELFLEFRSYSVPKTRSQIVGVCNVQTLLECGLFSEALDEILGSLQPGMLPPVPYLQTLMQHALQGEATPYFLCTFRKVLHTMLQCNTPWGIQSTVKYFTQVLQCPECKNGLWPFLQTSVRYCMASESTCHSLHSPASPELLHFHGDLQAFVLKLFQCEIHSAKTRETGGSRPSVLYGSFWSMWERTTLGSRPVLQLTQLVVQASEWELSTCQGETTDRARRQELRMTLQDTVSVVVEYWCQEHSRLNRSLVEKSLEDLAEHIAILCQDLPSDVLRDFVPSIPSTRLQLVTADAIFRNVCCRNGLTVGTEPLSLLKMVSSYLPALGRLCGRRPGGSRDPRADSRGPRPVTEPTSHSWTSQGSGSGMLSVLNNGTGPPKENIPRGLHKVNAAGETLLHRACKKNQVETLLHILALPGTDVNVKDHAGWTPLHEACNHGSSACVEALLLHCPAPHLNSQVGGVSPLHDALLNGHMDIAKMLLQHAGSALLQQRDGQGRTAMDLVTAVTLREELRRSALAGDLALEAQGSEVRDLPFLEVCSCLLAWLLACYLKERGAPILSLQAQDQPLSLGVRLARALEAHPAQKVAEGWGDPRLVSLLEDLETVLGVGRYLAQVCPAVRECQGPRTRFLISLLERLAGAASLAYTL